MGILIEKLINEAKEIIVKYPKTKSAILPLAHLAQDNEGYLSKEAMQDIATLLDLEEAEVNGTCTFYTMFKFEPVGKLLVSVCTNVTCLVNGGPELLDEINDKYKDSKDVTVEEVECLANCDEAPCLQVNYAFHNKVESGSASEIIEEYLTEKRVARGISGGHKATQGKVKDND
jgi:NADH-quinone oxidoreductase subunit E